MLKDKEVILVTQYHVQKFLNLNVLEVPSDEELYDDDSRRIFAYLRKVFIDFRNGKDNFDEITLSLGRKFFYAPSDNKFRWGSSWFMLYEGRFVNETLWQKGKIGNNEESDDLYLTAKQVATYLSSYQPENEEIQRKFDGLMKAIRRYLSRVDS